MNKKTAIFSILVLMLAFLVFGIINVAMGRPSLLTTALNTKNVGTNSSKSDKSNTEKIKEENYLTTKIIGEIDYDSSGDEVKKIQYLLKNKGYYKGQVDGQFMDELVQSIKAFQKNNNLEESGKLTIDVIEKITGEKLEVDYSKIAFTRDLYPNMTGIDVRKAQFILNKAGFYSGDITGVFDAETKKAVIKFQKDKKITQTGNIGKMTQKELDELI